MKPTHYIIRLKAAKKINDKKAILRQAAMDGNTILFEAFKLAYDPGAIFGVRKVPVIKGDFNEKELSEDIGEFGWADFKKLATSLQNQTLNGKDAKAQMRGIAEIVCINDWNHLYRAVLTKDMKCGVNAATINAILNEVGGDALKYLIPIWKLPVVKPLKNNADAVGPSLLEPYINSIRVITVIDKTVNTVYMLSKTGKIITEFPEIVIMLNTLLPMMPQSFVFDGEMVNGDHTAMKKKPAKDDDTSGMRYAITDMMILDDFNKGGTQMALVDRHAGLVELAPYFQSISGGLIHIVPKKAVVVGVLLDELRSFESESEYDGVVVKPSNSEYDRFKNNGWFWWKP